MWLTTILYMPKIPRRELDQMLDPNSQEHEPTDQEIQDEDAALTNARNQIMDVAQELRNPGTDWITGDIDPRAVVDPDDLWTQLQYIKDDLGTLHHSDERQDLLDRINDLERRLFLHFIPFISSRVYIYGYENSPLEKPTGFGGNRADVDVLVMTAESEANRLAQNDDEKAFFYAELSLLKDKLDKYEKEPTIFTFERRENKLYHDIRSFQAYNLRNRDRLKGALSDPKQAEDELKEYDEMIKRANDLKEIAKSMQDPEFAKEYERRADGLLWHTNMLKREYQLPEQFLRLEAQLKGAFKRAQQGEHIHEDDLDSYESTIREIEEIEDASSLKLLLKNIRHVLAGEPTEEEPDSFFEGAHAEHNWAWTRLGLTPAASNDEIRKAFHKIAFETHPDRDDSDETLERMKEASEAFEFLRELKKFR